MSTKYKFKDQDKLYFVSFAVVYWIDLFIRNEYKDILLDSWKFCQENKGLDLYAWCIMTSHTHDYQIPWDVRSTRTQLH